MASRITAHLHELVFAMDGLANHALTTRLGVDYGLFVFLNPLLDDTLDVTRLAARLNLTKAAVSKRVPVLERDGWVATSSDPAHGRRVLVSLTPRGRRVVAEAGSVLGQRFTDVLDGLAIDADRLDRDLVSMIGAVRAVAESELS